jgi:hypothetical protein
MTPDELRAYVAVMRDTGVAQLRIGPDAIVLGPAPRVAQPTPAPDVTPTERPAPIGPDGKPMSEHDQILFGHMFDEEAAQ